MGQDRVLKPDDVAEILGLGKTTVYKLLRAKQIPAVKIQHQYRIVESDLYEWLKSNTDCEIKIKQ